MGVYGHLPFEKWQDRYHTEATIDVAKFIDKKYYGTLLKLGVKIEERLYTGYEYEVMKLELSKYYVDENMDEEDMEDVVPLDKTGVTREEYNEVLKQFDELDRIYSENYL